MCTEFCTQAFSSANRMITKCNLFLFTLSYNIIVFLYHPCYRLTSSWIVFRKIDLPDVHYEFCHTTAGSGDIDCLRDAPKRESSACTKDVFDIHHFSQRKHGQLNRKCINITLWLAFIYMNWCLHIFYSDMPVNYSAMGSIEKLCRNIIVASCQFFW